MPKKSSIFILLIISLNALAISNNEDCEKRKCIKNIEEVLNATYVLIDPGHGGTDPGAPAADGETWEKDLNLDISNLLENRLIQLGIKNVGLTRETDVTLKTEFERPERIKILFARAKQKFQNECDEFYPIFISIHQNAHENREFNGTEERLSYWYGENGFQNNLPWMVDDKLREYFDAYGSLAYWCRPDLDVFEFGINMLKDGTWVDGEFIKMNIQHTLAEIGFVSNSDDLAKIKNNKQNLANSIADAIFVNVIVSAFSGDRDCPPTPHNDNPDDNYSFMSTISAIKQTKINSDSKAAVMMNFFPLDMIKLLNKIKHSPALVFSEFSPDEVKEHPVLIIPTGGLFGLENADQFKSTLADYVSRGGTIIVFGQQHGYEFSVLPTPEGEPIGAYGWREDQSCQTNSVYVDTWHPALSSATRSLISSPIDGYFAGYPSNSTVLLRRRVNGMPALLTYPYGDGRVVVTSMFEDWGNSHGQSTAQGRAIVRDYEMVWMSRPNLNLFLGVFPLSCYSQFHLKISLQRRIVFLQGLMQSLGIVFFYKFSNAFFTFPDRLI